MSYADFWVLLRQHSSLARILRVAYHSINGSKDAKCSEHHQIEPMQRENGEAQLISELLDIPHVQSQSTSSNLDIPRSIPNLSHTVASGNSRTFHSPSSGVPLESHRNQISTHAAILLHRDQESLIEEIQSARAEQHNSVFPHQDTSAGISDHSCRPQGLNHMGQSSTLPYALLKVVCSPIGHILLAFLSYCDGRRTLLQISRLHNLEKPIKLEHLRFLAKALIQCRLARAIPPLRAGDQYVLDPSIDRPALEQAGKKWSVLWEARCGIDFNMILSKLSGSGPQPVKDAKNARNDTFVPTTDVSTRAYKRSRQGAWRHLIPRKELKNVFMEALGWLIREGLVLRIASFAWIRVSDNLKGAMGGKYEHRQGRSKMQDKPPELGSKQHFQMFSQSPELTLISDPLRPTQIESQYLDHVFRSVLPSLATSEDEAAELLYLWPVLLKYFDGNHALEDIAVSEGRKRKELKAIFEKLAHESLLFTIRHW